MTMTATTTTTTIAAADPADPIRVLFLCTHNSARSQMAEGLLRYLGGDAFAAFSAGTEATRVHPLAIVVMREIDVDITGQRSKVLTEYLAQRFDAVITVCDNANDSCPTFPGKTERLHWSLPDPAAVVGIEAKQLAAFRAVRDALSRLLPPFIATARQRHAPHAPEMSRVSKVGAAVTV